MNDPDGDIPVQLAASMLDAMPNAALLVDAAGLVAAANPEAAALLGARDPAALCGRRAAELIPGAIEHGAPAEGARELVAHCLGGATRPVRIRVAALGAALWCIGLQDASAPPHAESDERSVFALAASGLGIWEVNTATHDLHCCARSLEIGGLADLGISFADAFEMLHPEDRGRCRLAFEKSMADRTPFEAEARIRWADGAERRIQYRAEWRRDATGAPVRLIGVVEDVTDARIAELQLREREERQRTLIEVLPDAILVNRADRIEFVNPSGLALFGASSPEEIVGRSPFELFHADSHALIRERIARMRAGEAVVPFVEEKLLRLDGRVVPVEVAAAPFEAAEGPAILVIARDMSLRKQAEEAARASARLIRTLVDALPQHLWMADCDGRMLFVNEQLRRYLGISECNDWTEVVHPDDRPAWAAAWVEARNTGEGSAVEARLRGREGRYRWFDLRALPVRNAEGVTEAWIGSSTDVHEARELRLALAADEQRFRQIATSSPGALFAQRMAPDGSMTFPIATDRIEEILGFPPAVVLADLGLAWERIHPDDREGVAATEIRSAQTLEPAHCEFRYSHPAGRMTWIECRATPTREPDGCILWHGFLFDVTERKQAEAALRDQERRIREIVDSVPQHVWMCDAAGKLVYVNRRHRDETGLDPASAESWPAWIHPEHRAFVEEAWRQTLEAGTEARIETLIRVDDGSHRWFDMRVRPLHDAAGQITGWVGTNTDIQEAREMRAALHREEERLAQIAEVAPGGLHSFRLAEDGTMSFPYASPRTFALYGFEPADVAIDATSLFERIHPDDIARVRESISIAAAGPSPWHCEFRYRHPDGREVWIEGSSTPAPDPDGQLLWHGFTQDVTARKQAEEALRTSRAQLLAALQTGGMSSWVWDLATNHLTRDPWMASVWGFGDGDGPISWERIESRIHPEDRARVRQRFHDVLAGGEGHSGEYRVVFPNDELRWMVTHAVLERDAEGRPVRVVGVHVDITERKRTQEAMLRAQKLEALGTLAGGIAHDFNNVLAAICGNAELASSLVPPEHEALEPIREIERASARAAEMVRRILSFSRPQKDQREVVALAPVVEEARRLMRATLPATIEITSAAEPDLPPVLADTTQLHQVIVNLVTNAAHAIGARPGRIEIRIGGVDLDGATPAPHPDLHPGRWVRLEVADDGDGMDTATLASIFDPFFTTRRAGGGSGLGLTVVHGIVKSHGGVITVQSAPGSGTRFAVWLPSSGNAIATRVAPAPARESSARGHARVLYVDDEASIVQLATRSLEALGYDVTAFCDPALAREAFCEQPDAFDLVVTDAAMPGISGLDLARGIHSLRPEMPIVLTSGYVRPEEESDARAAGVRELIQKPFSIRQLAVAIDRLRLPQPARAKSMAASSTAVATGC